MVFSICILLRSYSFLFFVVAISTCILEQWVLEIENYSIIPLIHLSIQFFFLRNRNITIVNISLLDTINKNFNGVRVNIIKRDINLLDMKLHYFTASPNF